tara:strand:+ start:4909 stop:5088 length:180 start_codon:yes stop_codon:yes gene_type:complete
MEVKVTVNPDGTTEIEVDGIKGEGCTKYTDAVVKALGGKVTSDQKKPEFHEAAEDNVKA